MLWGPKPPPSLNCWCRQDGSMISCCLWQILTEPSKSSSWNQEFFQASVVQVWSVSVNCSLVFLSLAERSGTGVVSSFCSPSSTRFHVLFSDGILNSLAVMSGCWHYCCLSFGSKQSVDPAYFTLTSNWTGGPNKMAGERNYQMSWRQMMLHN